MEFNYFLLSKSHDMIKTAQFKACMVASPPYLQWVDSSEIVYGWALYNIFRSENLVGSIKRLNTTGVE